MEQVYDRYYDTAGNYHWTGVCSGEHIERGEKMTENERKGIMNLADTIKGEINRMCVTKELSELDMMHYLASKNLETLAWLIYRAKFEKGETNG